MELNIRPLLYSDYDTILVDWWKGWRWTPPPRDVLPDDGKGGYIVFDGATPVCAGFVYVTNSKIGWVEWIVSNNKVRNKEVREESISMLIEFLTGLLRQSGCKYSYSIAKNENLIKHYQKFGYSKGSTNFTEMIKIL